MKIEIDTSNLVGLKEQERGLAIALAGVRAAIAAIEPQQPHVAVNGQFEPVVEESKAETYQEPQRQSSLPVTLSESAEDWYEFLPQEFTTPQAYELAESKGVAKGSARLQIHMLCMIGKLEIVQQGEGRRPTLYRRK